MITPMDNHAPLYQSLQPNIYFGDVMHAKKYYEKRRNGVNPAEITYWKALKGNSIFARWIKEFFRHRSDTAKPRMSTAWRKPEMASGLLGVGVDKSFGF